MSVYSNKTKGWRYDFILKGKRYSAAGFKTKRDAVRAEAKKREEIDLAMGQPETTDMVFLDLVNLRLDHVKAYNSESHYEDVLSLAKRWIQRWGEKTCSEITEAGIREFVLSRRKVSACVANKEIRQIKATFNFGIKRRWCTVNPAQGMEFFPEEKKLKFIPSNEEIERVLNVADPETRDYLITIRETMARVGEVNKLTWDDVDLERGFIVLYTRKKKGGTLTPRKVPMTGRLKAVMERRHLKHNPDKPWVFWRRYWSRKEDRFVEGPYADRKKIMTRLCREAGVRYFRYHALRHAGASIMETNNVPIGSIQRILGHENRTTTEIYLHSLGESERQAMDVFERVTGQKSHTSPTLGQKKGYEVNS